MRVGSELPGFLKIADENDAEQICRWMFSEQYAEFCSFTPISSYSIRISEGLHARIKSRESLFFLINSTVDGSGIPMGFYGLNSLDYACGKAEFSVFSSNEKAVPIGYFLRILKSGYIAVLDYAFRFLELEKIHAEVLENNLRALKNMKRLGFQLEGRCREKIFRQGRYQDTKLFSILRTEWPNIRNSLDKKSCV